jgi:hypothetical protein
MTDKPDPAPESDDPQLLAAKLAGETAKIPWSQLQRFFAQGRAVEVRAGTDLIAVGTAMSRDETDRIETWMAEGRVRPVPDDQAKRWVSEDALVWALVVRPWVLVQVVSD